MTKENNAYNCYPKDLLFDPTSMPLFFSNKGNCIINNTNHVGNVRSRNSIQSQLDNHNKSDNSYQNQFDDGSLKNTNDLYGFFQYFEINYELNIKSNNLFESGKSNNNEIIESNNHLRNFETDFDVNHDDSSDKNNVNEYEEIIRFDSNLERNTDNDDKKKNIKIDDDNFHIKKDYTDLSPFIVDDTTTTTGSLISSNSRVHGANHMEVVEEEEDNDDDDNDNNSDDDTENNSHDSSNDNDSNISTDIYSIGIITTSPESTKSSSLTNNYSCHAQVGLNQGTCGYHSDGCIFLNGNLICSNNMDDLSDLPECLYSYIISKTDFNKNFTKIKNRQKFREYLNSDDFKQFCKWNSGDIVGVGVIPTIPTSISNTTNSLYQSNNKNDDGDHEMSYLWNKITNSSNYGDFCNHNFYENDGDSGNDSDSNNNSDSGSSVLSYDMFFTKNGKIINYIRKCPFLKSETHTSIFREKESFFALGLSGSDHLLRANIISPYSSISGNSIKNNSFENDTVFNFDSFVQDIMSMVKENISSNNNNNSTFQKVLTSNIGTKVASILPCFTCTPTINASIAPFTEGTIKSSKKVLSQLVSDYLQKSGRLVTAHTLEEKIQSKYSNNNNTKKNDGNCSNPNVDTLCGDASNMSKLYQELDPTLTLHSTIINIIKGRDRNCNDNSLRALVMITVLFDSILEILKIKEKEYNGNKSISDSTNSSKFQQLLLQEYYCRSFRRLVITHLMCLCCIDDVKNDRNDSFNDFLGINAAKDTIYPFLSVDCTMGLKKIINEINLLNNNNNNNDYNYHDNDEYIDSEDGSDNDSGSGSNGTIDNTNNISRMAARKRIKLSFKEENECNNNILNNNHDDGSNDKYVQYEQLLSTCNINLDPSTRATTIATSSTSTASGGITAAMLSMGNEMKLIRQIVMDTMTILGLNGTRCGTNNTNYKENSNNVSDGSIIHTLTIQITDVCLQKLFTFDLCKSPAFVSNIQEKWANGEGVNSNRNRSNDIQDDYHRSIQISIQLLRLQQQKQHQQQLQLQLEQQLELQLHQEGYLHLIKCHRRQLQISSRNCDDNYEGNNENLIDGQGNKGNENSSNNISCSEHCLIRGQLLSSERNLQLARLPLYKNPNTSNFHNNQNTQRSKQPLEQHIQQQYYSLPFRWPS